MGWIGDETIQRMPRSLRLVPGAYGARHLVAGTGTIEVSKSDGASDVPTVVYPRYTAFEVWEIRFINFFFLFLLIKFYCYRPTHSSLYLLIDQEQNGGGSGERIEEDRQNMDPARLGNSSCVTKFVKTLLCLVSFLFVIQWNMNYI